MTAIGHIASSAASASQLSEAVDGLFSLFTHNTEAVQFAVGEALCFVFGGTHIKSCKHIICKYSTIACPYVELPHLNFRQQPPAPAQVCQSQQTPSCAATTVGLQPGWRPQTPQQRRRPQQQLLTRTRSRWRKTARAQTMPERLFGNAS